MAWGINQKLKDHYDMIESTIDSRIKPLHEHINKVDGDLQLYKLDCSERHRRSEDWVKTMTLSQQKAEISQENTERNVQCIKNILETYLPNLKDAEEKRATKHQVKEGALWISAVLGALLTVGTVIIAIFAYFNGYFTK